jgi:hypothetical protein
MDSESIEAGNLVRHTMTLGEVGQMKSVALAERLNAVSPHARVVALASKYPPASDDDARIIEACDMVFDCTGEDELLAELERLTRTSTTDFVSASLGRGALRGYIYTAREVSFPFVRFREALEEHERQDLVAVPEEDGLGEEPGCWHPLARATTLDVWRCAVAAVESADWLAEGKAQQPLLRVIERPSPNAPLPHTTDA